MRTMLMTVLGVGLLAGVGALVGCQAQREVAADKIKASIDGLLGDLDVKHKEVQLQIEALESGVNKVREAKIKHQVLIKQIDDRVVPLQEKQAETKTTMVKVQTALKEGTSVDLGGKTYSIEQLKKAGNQLIEKYKATDAEMKSAIATKPKLEKHLADLESKQAGYAKQIAQLKSSLKKIEADMISAKAYQEASAAMGSADMSMSENVDKLKENLADLDAKVQTVLLREDEKFNEHADDAQAGEAAEVINALKEPTDVSSELDAILGGK